MTNDSGQPDRYLENSHPSTKPARLKDPHLRDHWTFGVGRRICPGILVAQREIWLAVTKMLWAFVLEEVPGHPVDLNEYDGASGRSPVPFEIVLKPRFSEVVQVIAEAENAWTE
jgi:cytochrome P450